MDRAHRRRRIVGRHLDRQVATHSHAGHVRRRDLCRLTRHAHATDLTDHVRSGYCYRWVLTLTDAAGNRSTAYSGAVLVDASAPRVPIVAAERQMPRTRPTWARWASARRYVDATGRSGSAAARAAVSRSRSPPATPSRASRATSPMSRAPAGTPIGSAAPPTAPCAWRTAPGTAGTVCRQQRQRRGHAGPAATLTLAARRHRAAAADVGLRAERHDEEHPRRLLPARSGRASRTRAPVSSAQQIVGTLSRRRSMRTARVGRTASGRWRLPPGDRQLVGQRPVADSCYVWSIRTRRQRRQHAPRRSCPAT